MLQRRAFIATGGVIILAAGVLSYRYSKLSSFPAVQVETVERRDLTAMVTASGKIHPKRLVNISADAVGRVTRLAVEEGDHVKAEQFLLQIDPEALQSNVQRGEAGLREAREAVNAARVAVEGARAGLDLALQNRDRLRALYGNKLVSRGTLDQAESELEVLQSELTSRETAVRATEERLEQNVAILRSARHYLSKVTIESPMNGVITALNIEEGETVLVGTMNNPGTVLMTVADLSVIQAELGVDETNIVDVRLGQEASVTIDALPNRVFRGQVTKIGTSALRSNNPLDFNSRQATKFEVIVTVTGEVSEALPGFSCSAEITTAQVVQALAVPIQALTARELSPDPRQTQNQRTNGGNGESDGPASDPREMEGVLAYRDGKVEFVPIEVGIFGERYFEVRSGLQEGDRVIIGPYDLVRELHPGDGVRIAESSATSPE